ncbi:MAG: hypothetical protein ACRELG_10390 [Gemmataceae bacterium]
MKKNRRRNGLLVAADDLQPGLLVTIHHWRDRREWGMGVALRIEAINLPYLVAQPLNDAEARPAILDLRRMRLMRITEEFARAQATGTTAPAPAPMDDIPF